MRQSPTHGRYIPNVNINSYSNLGASFNGNVGQSINSNYSNINKSINSLISYPKILNQSYYQQDHYIQTKPNPTSNLLSNYLPSQIIHTSAVS